MDIVDLRYKKIAVICTDCFCVEVEIKGTTIQYGAGVRVMMVCPECGIQKEFPVTVAHISEFPAVELKENNPSIHTPE